MRSGHEREPAHSAMHEEIHEPLAEWREGERVENGVQGTVDRQYKNGHPGVEFIWKQTWNYVNVGTEYQDK